MLAETKRLGHIEHDFGAQPIAVVSAGLLGRATRRVSVTERFDAVDEQLRRLLQWRCGCAWYRFIGLVRR